MAILRLNGELMCDEWAELYRWFGYETGYFCPADVRAAIDALEPGEVLELEINSVGGDCDAAAEIYGALQMCAGRTVARIMGLAASAASYFLLACDRIEIAQPAQMMIHCASLGLYGNHTDHAWAAGMLQTTDRSILDTYCARCGEEHREELRDMMEKESFIISSDCVRLGLCDGLIERQSEEPQSYNVAASAMGIVARAMRTLPDVAKLRAKRDAQRTSEAEELEACRQRLALERERYH